jgi:CheY-like chemotaxis protein
MPRHIMIVEDDAEIRETLVDVMEDAGISTTAAINGRDALDKLRNAVTLPCLILLDLMMPVMDGRAFRQAQLTVPELCKIPVVLISAYQDLDRQAQELSVAGFLRKPLKLTDIRSYADRFCGGNLIAPVP